jgi:hypothetical protein
MPRWLIILLAVMAALVILWLLGITFDVVSHHSSR